VVTLASLPTVLYRGILPDTTQPVRVTVPTGKRWIITNLVLTNTSPTPGAPTTATVALDGVPLIAEAFLDPGALLTLDCAQVLDTGKSVTLRASSAATVAAHLSGVESDT
jgi:hypothetical protein